MVELKAIIQLENMHLPQGKNYLEAYNIQVGLLINFGSQRLQFKPLENQKFVENPLPLTQENLPKSWFRSFIATMPTAAGAMALAKS